MSRQNNFAKRQFFNSSIAHAKVTQKKRKDIQSIKNGNVVEPDPKVVTAETIDETVADPEVVTNE